MRWPWLLLAALLLMRKTRAKETEQGASLLDQLGIGGFMAPRGIRNNNPLNIELGANWQGMAPDQTDGRFVQFIDPRFGYRAAAKILASYARRGVVTLRGIVATWAPSHENNVEAYVDSVSARSGIDPLQVVGPQLYPALFEAMTWHENGQQPYSLALIEEGVQLAYA